VRKLRTQSNNSKFTTSSRFQPHLKRVAVLPRENTKKNKTLKWPSKVTLCHRKCHGSWERIWLSSTISSNKRQV